MTYETSQPLRARIEDVARRAGVSTATVSRVLNNSAPVSSSMTQRVLRAIEELNYVPSEAARALASQELHTIGLILHEISSPVLPPLLKGIEAVARGAGYRLLIATVGHAEGADTFISPLGEQNTDGLLVYASSVNENQLQRLSERHFPVVLMHQHSPEALDIPTVNVENQNSARQLAEHLIEDHGCHRIAFLAGPSHQQDSVERELGYRQALAEHNIPFDPELLGYGGFDEDIAYSTVTAWLQNDTVIDAVFGDDESARGVLQAIKDAGKRVPEDVSVVGFDDDPLARHLSPSLTTVGVPVEKVGQEAAQRLFRLIQDGEADSIVLPTELVIRQSCGCQ